MMDDFVFFPRLAPFEFTVIVIVIVLLLLLLF